MTQSVRERRQRMRNMGIVLIGVLLSILFSAGCGKGGGGGGAPVQTWAKTYGGAQEDRANSIQQTSDGGYIVAGYTDSFGGGRDSWVLKLRADGTLIDDGTGTAAWQKRYGETDSDYAESVQQTSDGGYIVAGHTNSFGAVYDDFWVVKLDSYGMATCQKRYGRLRDSNKTSSWVTKMPI
jgi:hypothetical protein